MTWSDSCLGAGQPDEVCAEVITSGWIVLLRDHHGLWPMHTDLFGERMRRGPDLAPTVTPEPTATPTIMPSATPTPVPPTPTVAPGALRLYDNPFFRVTFQYPDHWQHQEGEPQTGERYGGSDGFFLLGAIDAGDQPLDTVATNEAGHVLRPYGTDPSIESLVVTGQEARLILPSADQSMGPLGQALLIVRFPAPVEIGGHRYPLFTLTADPAHILDLASTLAFTTG
jgi:TolB protein